MKLHAEVNLIEMLNNNSQIRAWEVKNRSIGTEINMRRAEMTRVFNAFN